MNMDLDYSLMENSQYLYSENMRIIANEGSDFGVAQTIEGFEQCQPDNYIPSGETIIHTDVIRKYGIVITVDSTKTKHSVYRFNFTKSDISPEVRMVFSGNLDIREPISSACRWENDDVIKFYWADGHNQLRVINISPTNDEFNRTIDPDSLNILPHSSLEPLKLLGYGGGLLPVGKIQYCYQLFNLRGNETSVSPISNIFRLSRNDIGAASVIGSDKTENSGKSIKLRAIIQEKDSFRYARIISIMYPDSTSIPTIKIVNEVPIISGEINYEDSGVGAIAELTMAEFNALTTYMFIPKVISTKDNILFAANVIEDTWDVDFDARAYRANYNNIVKLNSSSLVSKEFTISDISNQIIDETYDAINPYNTDTSAFSVSSDFLDLNRYVYGIDAYGARVEGGNGINVSYRFITTDLVEDSSKTTETGLQTNSASIFALTANVDSLPLRYIDNNTSAGVLSLGDRITRAISYADPSIDSLVKGYQRDEVYRFGLVFYNNQNVASSVHWIGDIRMPRHSSRIFDTNAKVTLTNGNTYSNLALVTHPLGIEFTIKNIPAGVVGVEIVRAKRTYADRSIAMQGAISRVGVFNNFDTLTGNDLSTTRGAIRPYQFLTWSVPGRNGYITHPSPNDAESVDTHYFDGNDRLGVTLNTTSSNTILFTCPEIGIMRDSITEGLMSVDRLEPIYRIFSQVQSNGQSTNLRTFANIGSGNNLNDGLIYSATRIAYPSIATKLVLLTSNSDNDSRDSTSASNTIAKYYSNVTFENQPGIPVESTVITASTYIPPLDWNNANIFESLDLITSATASGSNLICNAAGNLLNFKGFMDYSDTDWETYSAGHKEGLGGAWVALTTPDIGNIRPTENELVALSNDYLNYAPSATVLCNLRKPSAMYGGNTYSSRNNTLYISTGITAKIDSSRSAVLRGFGGDTYIGIYDYLHNSQWYLENDYSHYKERKNVHSAYIPCESTVNVSMMEDVIKASRNCNINMQNNISVIGSLYTQDKPRYAYNDVYSREGDVKLFVNKGIYSIDDLTTDTRILHSESKTNLEVSDSWTKFRPANYLDLETEYGPITNMEAFGNNLMVFQSDALSIVPINERAIITDNNPGALTLGTGSVMGRANYATKLNGLYPGDLRSVTQSDSTLYWYDRDRFEICAFNGQLQTLSKLKGVQTYLVQNKEAVPNNPNVVYDKKYNDVLFTLGNTTLVFNEQIGAFTSFYTFNPNWYFEFGDHLYTFKAKDLYLYNAGIEKNLYDNKSKVTKLTFVVNKDYTQSKTFDSIQYDADVTWLTNLDNIKFETKRQTSLITKSNQIDYREDTYKFAIPRSDRELNEIQELVNKSYRDRMKGKYLISYYEYDNNNGRQFKLPYINTYFRHSFI